MPGEGIVVGLTGQFWRRAATRPDTAAYGRGIARLHAARRVQSGPRLPHRPRLAVHGDPRARRRSRFEAQVPPVLARRSPVQRAHPDPLTARRQTAGRGHRVKLVTFGEDRRVGVLEGDEIAVLDVPTMREYFERGGADETGERVSLAETRLRAPIVPKKLIHTAGNFREHEDESKQVGWSHEIAPWIVFFQNVDAIVGPRRAGRLSRAPDRGARLRARARGRDREGGEVVPARGGARVHRRLRHLQRHHRPRHPAARDALRRLLVLQGDRHLLPARPLDRHPRRDPRPARPGDGAARERRVAPDLALRVG